MATSVYSFGEDSPLKFEISDKMAQHYNEAVTKYLKAQRRFNQKFGRRWDPLNDPIHVRWSRKQRQAWNQFAEIFHELRTDMAFHPNDIMDDYLVINAAETASKASKKWGRVITLAVGFGALYGFLRGL